jgi:hypothetical protein
MTKEPMSGLIYTMVARDKLDRPDADMVAIELMSQDRDGIDATRITLADVPLYVRGHNKGRRNYRNSTGLETTYLVPSEVEHWLTEHPDVCRQCADERKLLVRASVKGATFRPCPSCNADGSITEFEPAVAS